jgi:transposase
MVNRSVTWGVYCSGTDAPNDSVIPNIVLYDYNDGRRTDQVLKDHLGGYNGYIHADGYASYNNLDATVSGCWAHARRPFKQAKTIQPKGATGKADWAINHIQKRYRIETRLKNSSPAHKYKVRQ